MFQRICQMEPQEDDTISWSVCGVFLITLSAPWPEDVSCLSPYAPQAAYYHLGQSFPTEAPPQDPIPHCFCLSCCWEAGRCQTVTPTDPVTLQVHRNEVHDSFANHTTDNELNLSSKEKKTFIFFYCINNGKLDSFLYRLYIYRQVWLEKTFGKYGSQFSFIH